jgi:RNA-binding protein YlmH
MDRRELLDRAARDGEERLLLGRVLDKYDQCRRRSVPTHTEFLSPQEQAAAERLLHMLGTEEGFVRWGGYEGAERCQLHFLPEWQEEPERGAVRCLRCTFYEPGRLTHRDFLGSLMGLGLTREKIGDILVAENEANVLVADSVADFLLRDWTAAGRTPLKVEEIEPSELKISPPQVKEIRDTVSSLRLDSVLSVGFSTSRGKAAEAVETGRVQVNWTVCLKPDKPVAEGDVISVRGAGKCRLTEVGSVTRKGRVFITVQRYI